MERDIEEENTVEGDGMKLKRSILCFEHCEKRIFSMDELPSSCIICDTPIFNCQLKIPPFAVPSPFQRATDFPCSIVIKPTKGNFLEDYTNKSNLHIAITNSDGNIFEFDRGGLRCDRPEEWNSCLVLDLGDDPLLQDIVEDPDWGEYWDLCLDKTYSSNKFSKESYDEDENNCFNFVLTFLTSLNQAPFTGWAASKVEFCQKLILPKTVMAAKYIMLYRKVRDHQGIMVVD